MQTFLKASRFLLPAVFLGYAGVANLAVFADVETILPESVSNALEGGLTARIDSLYRDQLPHIEPSVGLVGAGRYLLLGEGRKGVFSGSEGWLFTEEELRPVTPEMLEAAVLEIKAAQERIAEVGAKLVMVPLPAKIDIHSDMAASSSAAGAMEDAYVAFLEGLSANGIEAIDTRTAMLSANSGGQMFLRTDTHWTIEGATVVSQAVAKGVAPGTETFEIEAQALHKFTGDLVSFVTSETLAPAIGLGPESVQPIVATAPQDGALTDLFGTDTVISTALVGTSYSANEAWSFVETLKIATSRDILNLAEEGRGPGVPMAKYLESAEFADMPPELVLWEFPVRYLSDPKLWPEPKAGGV